MRARKVAAARPGSASIAAATQSTATFTGEGQDAERVNAMRVSAD